MAKYLKKPYRRNGKRKFKTQRSKTAPILAQGAGTYTRAAFGVTATGPVHQGFNALSPVHLALPRPVAPYTVVRYTNTFTSTDGFLLFGTWYDYSGYWLNTFAIGRNNSAASQPVGGSTNTWGNFRATSSLAADGLTAVPAAMTVQVMCPTALQTASGMVTMSLCTQALEYIDVTSVTTEALFDNLEAVNQPRLLTAGKLALRGVQADLYPLNMNLLSDFESLRQKDTSVTWEDGNGTSQLGAKCAGFSPLYVRNRSGAELTYVITVEWRVRFQPTTIAAASHVYHQPASLSTWDNAVKAAVNMGHGVRDIAEVVAETGQAIGRAYATGKALSRLPAAAAAALPALA